MPKGRPNKSHISVHLLEREGEAVLPRAGIFLRRKCEEPGVVDELQQCRWYVVIIDTNTYLGVSEMEYARLQAELA